MKNKSLKIVAVCLLTYVIVAGSLYAEGAQEKQKYVIKLAHSVTLSDPLHPSAEKFKELAEEYTEGRVEIQLFPNGQLGDEQEIVQSMRSGAIEMGLVYTGNCQALAPSIGVVMLPYMFKNSQEAWYALDAIIDKMNPKLVKEAGVRALAFYEKGFRVLTNSKKPVEKLEDLMGLKIRVSPTDIPIKTFKSWGINPVPMAWGEVFTALQQGVIDGQENPYTTIPAFKFDEVQKYVTEIHYMIWTGPLLISEVYYQKLPKDIQELLKKAARDSADWERQFAASLKGDAIAKCKAAGMVLLGPPKDEDEWQKRARSIWPDFYKDVGGEAWVKEALAIMIP